MKIWIDLSNSPHALLFGPVAQRLEELGHSLVLTARDNAQTVELARRRWPDVIVVGGESPGGRAAKGRALAGRVKQLRDLAAAERPDIALSHNSYAQIVAARLTNVPAVTAMDYEFQPANNLAFRLAKRVLLPDALRQTGVARQGASARKTRFYAGFKEELYLADFEPDRSILESPELGLDGRTLVVLRSPPARALYHRFGNPLFEEILLTLGSRDDLRCVVLTRHREQREHVQSLDLPSIVAPSAALETRSLMTFAGLVVGAGGTMTREAALLGAPTASVFAGEMPAVDRALEREGLLRRIESVDELPEPSTDRPDGLLANLRARQRTLTDWLVAETLAVRA
jgi:uncharacterized protein